MRAPSLGATAAYCKPSASERAQNEGRRPMTRGILKETSIGIEGFFIGALPAMPFALRPRPGLHPRPTPPTPSPPSPPPPPPPPPPPVPAVRVHRLQVRVHRPHVRVRPAFVDPRPVVAPPPPPPPSSPTRPFSERGGGPSGPEQRHAAPGGRRRLLEARSPPVALPRAPVEDHQHPVLDLLDGKRSCARYPSSCSSPLAAGSASPVRHSFSSIARRCTARVPFASRVRPAHEQVDPPPPHTVLPIDHAPPFTTRWRYAISTSCGATSW